MADTGHGVVVELALPSMRVERQLKLFTAKEHVNTLAVWPPGSPGAPADGGASLWAVLHNLGASQLAQVDLASGAVVRRLRRVGDKSHGLSLWRNKAIMLSSGQGRLIAVDIESAIRHGDDYEPTTLWEDPKQTFMKGLVGAPARRACAAPAPRRAAPRCAAADVALARALARAQCLMTWRTLASASGARAASATTSRRPPRRVRAARSVARARRARLRARRARRRAFGAAADLAAPWRRLRRLTWWRACCCGGARWPPTGC